MRGLTASERRGEQLQSLTFLGLLADKVALATRHYPKLSEHEVDALRRLQDLLETVESPGTAVRPALHRRMSMSDPTAVLRRATVLANEIDPAPTTPADLSALRAPIGELLAKEANSDAIATVEGFADMLSRVTLLLADELANEKGLDDWTFRASSYSAV